MSRVRCPQKRCSFWVNGWCDADEIELDLKTLSCMTFDEMELPDVPSGAGEAADKEEMELEWLDEESIFEDDMDESLYALDDGDPELEDEKDDLLEEEDSWPL
jgi:hypothetical protein